MATYCLRETDKNNMRLQQWLTMALLGVLPPTLSALEDLEPPDVDFYAAIQGTRTDARQLEGDYSENMRLTLGAWMNELRLGELQFALESSFDWMGESRSSRSFDDTVVVDGDSSTVPVDVDETTFVDLNGLSVGGRVMHEDTVFLRAGAFYYNARVRTRRERTAQDAGQQDFGTVTDTERTSSVTPYLGAGLEAPLGRTPFRLQVDYSAYWLESERVDTAAIGLNYRM